MWQADMFAWEMAVAHHNVSQLRFKHLQISNTLSIDQQFEAFPLIDDWHRDTCHGDTLHPKIFGHPDNSKNFGRPKIFGRPDN